MAGLYSKLNVSAVWSWTNRAALIRAATFCSLPPGELPIHETLEDLPDRRALGRVPRLPGGEARGGAHELELGQLLLKRRGRHRVSSWIGGSIRIQEQGIVPLQVGAHRRDGEPRVAERERGRRHRRRVLEPEPLLDLVAADDRLGETRREGRLHGRRPVERGEEQQVVELRPERAGAGPDAVQVLPGRRPERRHGLDLPVGLGAGLGRQEPIGVGREHHLDARAASSAHGAPPGACRTTGSRSPHRPGA